MQDILTDITHHKRMEVELMKQTTPQNELEKQLAEATLPASSPSSNAAPLQKDG